MKKLKESVKGIPARKGVWKKKEVMLNLDKNHRRFGKFRKTEYRKTDFHSVAEITLWNSPEDKLLIDIDTTHSMKIDGMFSPNDIRRVRLSEEDIFMLADRLKELKKIPLKEWMVRE